MGTSTLRAFEFQLQCAVPAEDLRCGQSVLEFHRMRRRVETALALATDMCMLLEPRGWRLLAVRFEEEVCVVLSKIATADVIRHDIADLPASVLAEIGNTVRICATAGEHIFELAFADGSLRPSSPADVS
jgi:hypothetical protein